ncbi:unnamed protein product [Orchesella dallaii]|uniref:Uncharacterized protein n=1 Tax=Orchesella dallaii TaxID=48710 RepID=A0ABP1PTK9_9HEXA
MASSESRNFVAENKPIDLSSICYAITSPNGEILQRSGRRGGSWIIKSHFDVTLRPHKLTFIETGLMVYLADCTYKHIGDPTDAFETHQFKVLMGNLEYADCDHLMVAVRGMVEDCETLADYLEEYFYRILS